MLSGCDRLSVKDELSDLQFELVDHRGEQVIFPDSFEGKTILIGYLYTTCPDICPMITYNMRDVEMELDTDELHFISISFDPDRDTPEMIFMSVRDRFSLFGCLLFESVYSKKSKLCNQDN